MTLFTSSCRMSFEILCCLGWGAVLLDSGLSDHHCIPGKWSRCWSVAGCWWECLVLLTCCFIWVTESPKWMSQMKSKLYIFSSSEICHIWQKWYLNNHVVKSFFNKSSFHVQFYIMRTFQNALAHLNTTLLM